MKDQDKRIRAKQIVIYHQTPDEDVALYQDRRVLKQGETFDLRVPHSDQ
jgi:hypothetical protein